MAVLSDRSIKQAIESGRVKIEPYDPALVQPASLDVRLGNEFKAFRNHAQTCIDPTQPNQLTESITVKEGQFFIIHPGEFILGTTLEVMTLSDDIVVRLEGKSSMGRMGLLIHATAGFVDPGFSGQLTLEISNISNLPIKLYPGMRIGQVSFHPLDQPAEKPYGSRGVGKYQGQMGPTESRVAEEGSPEV
ncbi:dCTP deaminase [candidate division Kazan bacterium RBG_13_50_9]|uniref:dCTP deaminase, dUMP-forming n=1 Tax=candidate division Kazan bacterium RBG_13_50_9 TaxID=1798535 RepID=A0A1F4NU82_UNCK3|nr:MAG: dCTP deaminase [candidate division Kazan bacterium RBG_13_50_9]